MKGKEEEKDGRTEEARLRSGERDGSRRPSGPPLSFAVVRFFFMLSVVPRVSCEFLCPWLLLSFHPV
jgi:hypothetical protein